MQNISVQIMRFVDGSFPGWVECELVDADGKRHVIRDKVPIFTAELLDDKSRYPVTACNVKSCSDPKTDKDDS